MTILQLREIIQAQPFRPFKLNLADGRTVPVNHPEFIAAHPTGRTAIVFEDDDVFKIIDVMLITSIEVA